MSDGYQKRLRSLLSPAERRVIARLTTPQRVQDFLDTVPIHFAPDEEIFSPRIVLRERRAHCAEGALFAAAALAYHGAPPLLMDFQTLPSDEDHVVAVFKQRGLWGAVSKTNHSVLRWRDPLYKTVRELAMSFAHEYYLWNGRKSLLAYSAPFDLSRFAPEKWVTATESLDWLLEALDDSRHLPVAPPAVLKAQRSAAQVELRALRLSEWPKPRTVRGRKKPR